MNLKRAGRSQRSVPLFGYDRQLGEWVPQVSLGTLRANDKFPTSTDYSVKKRTYLCSDKDRIEEVYRLVRAYDQIYLVEAEQPNVWRSNVYQYQYQLRICLYRADIFRFVTQPKASGAPGQAVRTAVHMNVPCDFAAAGRLTSSEIDAGDYARAHVFLPGDLTEIDADVEIDIDGQTYDAMNVHRVVRLFQITTVRRGDGNP